MGGAARGEVGSLTRRDIARLRRVRARQRILQVALGIVAGIASFALGAVTRDVISGATTYPYAMGTAATVAGARSGQSSTSEKKLVLMVVVALSVVLFTLGVLLTEGHAESTAPSLGVAPEYGVFH